MDIATIDEIKKSFRVAFQFAQNHLCAMNCTDEYRQLACDLTDVFAENKDDPLACRLVSGVYDYICAESKRLSE